MLSCCSEHARAGQGWCLTVTFNGRISTQKQIFQTVGWALRMSVGGLWVMNWRHPLSASVTSVVRQETFEPCKNRSLPSQSAES